ncbi:YbdD/YjiX family protein [Arthrobacter sp.]|uniref:YbdD/YjiX family protein n=1 Tax=Arthrobacter sp. TaxID=1667 RepID=UPI0026E062FF|nr:YbdD/YjiX family protein [Arthrobacter sp.]MDO5752095.1 YbdD/YjiX family protein [Arthrobacter sp.]
MNVLRSAGRTLRSVNRYLKGVLGEDSYEKYLQHHEGTGCAAAPMTMKEFWRDKTDRQDKNPEGRCC